LDRSDFDDGPIINRKPVDNNPVNVAPSPQVSQTNVCGELLVDLVLPFKTLQCLDFSPVCIFLPHCCIPGLCLTDPLCAALKTVEDVLKPVAAGTAYCEFSPEEAVRRWFQNQVYLDWNVLTGPLYDTVQAFIDMHVTALTIGSRPLSEKTKRELWALAAPINQNGGYGYSYDDIEQVRIVPASYGSASMFMGDAPGMTLDNLVVLPDDKYAALFDPANSLHNFELAGYASPSNTNYAKALSTLSHELVHVAQFRRDGKPTRLDTVIFYLAFGYYGSPKEGEAFWFQADIATARKGHYCDMVHRRHDTNPSLSGYTWSCGIDEMADGGMILSDANLTLAINPDGGAVSGAELNIVNDCGRSHDCHWIYVDGMIVNRAYDFLALSADGGAVPGTKPKLVRRCTKENPNCTWTYKEGLLLSDANPGLAIAPSGGATHTAQLTLTDDCTKSRADCTWSMQNAQIFNVRNGSLVLALKPLQKNVSHGETVSAYLGTMSEPEGLWVLHKGMISPAVNPNLAIHARAGAHPNAELELVNNCSEDNPDCTFIFHKGMIQSGADQGLIMAKDNNDVDSLLILKDKEEGCPDGVVCTWFREFLGW
jgi:hypothetical protein